MAKTRRAIQEAFLNLLVEQPYPSITVQDILNRADVGRSTFYAHFSGKDDLLQLLLDSICDHALAPTEPERGHDFSGKEDPASVIEHMLCHLREREGGVRALIVGENAGMFTRYLRRSLVDRAEDCLPAYPPGPAHDMDRGFLTHHLAGSFVEMVIWWADDGFAADPKRLSDDYLRAIGPLFEERAQRS